MAQRTGRSLQDLAETAVERYRRERLLDEANAAFAKWRLPAAEREAWEATLADGIERAE